MQSPGTLLRSTFWELWSETNGILQYQYANMHANVDMWMFGHEGQNSKFNIGLTDRHEVKCSWHKLADAVSPLTLQICLARICKRSIGTEPRKGRALSNRTENMHHLGRDISRNSSSAPKTSVRDWVVLHLWDLSFARQSHSAPLAIRDLQIVWHANGAECNAVSGMNGFSDFCWLLLTLVLYLYLGLSRGFGVIVE